MATRGLALVESITHHTEYTIRCLKEAFAKLEPAVELVLKDITDPCMLRPDAPYLFGDDAEDNEVNYNGVSFIIIAGPVYAVNVDLGLKGLIMDKKRFNLPDNLKNLPMFGVMVADMMAGRSDGYLYKLLKEGGFDVRNSYSCISPLKSGGKTDEEKFKTFYSNISEMAADICRLAKLDKSSENGKKELKEIEKKMKISKSSALLATIIKPKGIMIRMVGHDACKIEDNCIGYGKCVRVCMRGVLKLGDPDENGKRKAVLVDSKNCIGCGRCYENCPVAAISKPTHEARYKLWKNKEYEELYGPIPRVVKIVDSKSDASPK